MEWVLRSPQIHSTFGNLGFIHGDGYHINENCNAALETILHNILTEDKYLRTYRRCISFGQNIKKDLIPLLIHTKDDKTVELLVRILVNLTIPVECLLSVDFVSMSDIGRHTIFEINTLLASTKVAFTDSKAMKVVIGFLRKSMDGDQQIKLSSEQCTNISNSLLLLRNVLHIPEEAENGGSNHCMQNQILWNCFSLSIDKVLIRLMTISDATNWGVTMVQLIALLYKDQHVVTLHKLLNIWLETSLSESSEDNESNTSPPDRGSEDSSPMLTSDPTSDSSDNGGSGKSNDEPNSLNNGWDESSVNNASEKCNQIFQRPQVIKKENAEDKHNTKIQNNKKSKTEKSNRSDKSKTELSEANEKKNVISENSDCGYGTQFENQESISTSSNEDDLPAKKPVHQKPHNPKQRVNTNKIRSTISLQEKKRKKLVKRGKSNLLYSTINVQGLSHKIPNDDDVSNIIKEFTVDFLLQGYNSLVQTLHSQILTNPHLEIDTSHFFWLVTYFLKFATQIELDLEHVCSVLSFDIISYLTAEGVNLCEQFELAIKLDGNDLKPCIRRLHLVVTAIREFVQAIEVYKKFSHMCSEKQKILTKLQLKMCETEELRSLLVLLLRFYNPKYHTKQYLQDLVVTNHKLLIFHDNVMKLPEYKGSASMTDHLRQFATPEIMYQYGILLEDYLNNGEFVNDCIFTLMHHVGGELECLISLFQPKILTMFTTIWKSEYEICDDWSDLIEYVINTFIKKSHTLQTPTVFNLDTENFEDEKATPMEMNTDMKDGSNTDNKMLTSETDNVPSEKKWTEEELSSLNWNYMQCNKQQDVVGELAKLLKEDGITKSRNSISRELLKQNLMNKKEHDIMSKRECGIKHSTTVLSINELRENEISKLCDQLVQDGKSKFLNWVQNILLEICFTKINLAKKSRNVDPDLPTKTEDKTKKTFEIHNNNSVEFPVMSPVSYHKLNFNQSVPLVPWNCEQASICKDLKFLQLLNKLGFLMPLDTGKVFIRIPNFWSASFTFEVAGKISPVDTSKLKFSVNDMADCSHTGHNPQDNFMLSPDHVNDISLMAGPQNVYQIQKQKYMPPLINFTPMPGASFHEPSKSNWLDLVQKSQECKIISASSTAGARADDGLSDVTMGAPLNDDDVIMTPLMMPPTVCPIVLSSVMTTTQKISEFNVSQREQDYYNSACETASVASDRMYVSDEDEKPDSPIVLASPLSVAYADDMNDADADVDTAAEEPADGDADTSIDSTRVQLTS